jgi:hypothetical protein
MATSRRVAALVERQCSHAQSPEAGWGGAPRFSSSRMLREGGDVSTRYGSATSPRPLRDLFTEVDLSLSLSLI